MTTGLPPPAPSGTPPPRVQLPSHEIPGGAYPLETVDEQRGGWHEGEHDPEAAYRGGNLTAGLFPMALIVFLIVAFVVIAWTVVAAAASA